MLSISTLKSISRSLTLIYVISFITFFFGAVPAAQASGFTVLDDRVFLRSNGKPFVDSETFSANNNINSIKLEIYNGGRNDEYNRVSSADIWLNGQHLFGPSDFNQQVDFLSIDINLELVNTLEVKLSSQPGSVLVINVAGELTNQSPIITSTAITIASEDAPYQYNVEATDPDIEDVLSYSLTQSPAGMNIDASSGLISWTPDNTQVGNHSVSIKVQDLAGLFASQSYSLSVSNVNDAPSISSIPVTIATEDVLYQYDVAASDPDVGDILGYSLTQSPTGMSIDASSGLISWTPNNAQVGSHSVTVKVQDLAGLFDKQSFNLTVINTNDKPIINSTPVTNVNENTTYSYHVVATDIDVNDSLTFSLTVAPSGMSIDSASGLISWSPTATEIGTHSVSILISDAFGLTSSQSFTLTVNNVNEAPVISSTPITRANESTAYVYSVIATDPDADDSLTFSLTIAPTGMIIDASSGMIDWTPNHIDVGEHIVTIVVKDVSGLTDSQNFTLNVSGNNEKPVITSRPTTQAFVGAEFRYALVVHDINNALLTYSLKQAPEGMSIDANTGLLTWTPIQEGLFKIEVNVVNHLGLFDSQSFSLIVTGAAFWTPAKDYWFAFGRAGGGIPSNGWEVSVLISSEIATQGSLEVPGLDLVIPFEVQPEQVTTILFDLFRGKPGAAIINSGVHITADDDISVSAVDFQYGSSDASQIFPTYSLGKKYIVLDHDANGRQTDLTLVATEANTQLTLIPSSDILLRGPGTGSSPLPVLNGESFDFNLNQQGDVTRLSTTLNSFTGASIISNKPIAIFGGSPCMFLPSLNWGPCDHLYQQIPPIDTWSQSYFALPFAGRNNGDLFRVVAAFDNTELKVNGEVITLLNKGEWYEHMYHEALIFEANHPILVAQFQNGALYDTGVRRRADRTFDFDLDLFGDPLMMLAVQPEQFKDAYTFGVPEDHWAFNYVNVFIPESGLDNLHLDDVLVDRTVFHRISNSSIFGGQLKVNPGAHRMTANQPFGIAVDGMNPFDTYGYIAGGHIPNIQSIESINLQVPDVNPEVGAEVCLQINTLASQEPVAAGRIDVTVEGVNNGLFHGLTNSLGVAHVCYQGLHSGTDTITAQIGDVQTNISLNWQKTNPLPIKIISNPKLVGFIDHSYQYQIITTDTGSIQDLDYQLLEAPSGMTINQNGMLQWIPGSMDTGSYPIEIQFKNGQGFHDKQRFNLMVTGKDNRHPVIIFVGSNKGIHKTAWIGKRHLLTMEAVDVDDSTLEFEIIQGPEGLNLFPQPDLNKIALVITPDANQIGIHRVGIRAKDNRGGSIDYFYNLIIKQNNPPYAVKDPSSQAKVGLPYHSRLVFADDDPEHNDSYLITFPKVRYLSGGPEDFSIHAYTGEIQFTPTISQNYEVVVELSDTVDTVEYTFPIHVSNEYEPFKLNIKIEPQIIQPGESIQISAQAIGAAGDVSFTGTVNDSEIIFDDSNTAVFTATQRPGLYHVIVDADDGSQFVSKNAAFLVVDPSSTTNNSAPQITSTPPLNVLVGNKYEYQIIAADADGDDLIFTLVDAAEGMHIDPVSGIISWSPLAHQVGTHNISIIVYDVSGDLAKQNYMISVIDDNHVPQVLSTPITHMNVEDGYLYQVIGKDIDGDKLTYQLINPPSGMDIDPGFGIITWPATIDQVGRHNIQILIQDSRGASSNQNYDLVVTATGPVNRRVCR